MFTVQLNEERDKLIVAVSGPPDEFRRHLDVVRGIPGRRWNQDLKVWEIPVEQAGVLVDRVSLNDMNLLTPPSEIPGLEALGFEAAESLAEPVKFDVPVDNREAELFRGQDMAFQRIGASFLYHMKRAMLLDEFGLGKSVEALRAVLKGKVDGEIKKTLVVTKASLKSQWVSEIRSFTPLTVVAVGGDRRQREQAWARSRDADITVINYDLLIQDLDFKHASSVYWDCIVVDEAQMVKNRAAKRSKALLKLRSRYFFILTATPVQNRAEEIFNLFKYIDPRLLGTWKEFSQRYIIFDAFFKPKSYKNLWDLNRRIAPYILKRTVEDVGHELPDVIRNVYEVEMTPVQMRLHSSIESELEEAKDQLKSLQAKRDKVKPEEIEALDSRILGLYNLLIEVCDSPELLATSESPQVRKRVRGLTQKDMESPKLREALELIGEFVERGEKVVVFSQYPRVLDILACDLKNLTGYAMLYGAMENNCRIAEDCRRCAAFGSCNLRKKSLWRFWNEPECMVFLSTDAGSAGLNLQCASCLINVDLPWNPSDADQRNGRIRRIGSRFKSVRVIDLVTSSGIDKALLETHRRKRDIIDQIVEPSMGLRKAVQELTLKVLHEMRAGAS